MDALETVDWGTHFYGSVLATRACTTRSLRRLAELGLVEAKGEVLVYDGDFAVEPERYRDGWSVTERGRVALAVAGREPYERRK